MGNKKHIEITKYSNLEESEVLELSKHQKGKLYFGIRKNDKILGQKVSDKTLRDIHYANPEHIEPRSIFFFWRRMGWRLMENYGAGGKPERRGMSRKREGNI